MTEQVVRMGLMWILAGLSAGWLAETLIVRRGYGLLVDMGLGVGAGLLGGGVFMMVSGRPSRNAGHVRLRVRPRVRGDRRAAALAAAHARRAGAEGRAPPPRAAGHVAGEKGTASGLHGAGRGVIGRPAARVLMRVATTGIYLLRGVPLELQRAARVRAVSDGTTLHQVLLKGLGEYAAGTWTPQPGDKRSAA